MGKRRSNNRNSYHKRELKKIFNQINKRTKQQRQNENYLKFEHDLIINEKEKYKEAREEFQEFVKDFDPDSIELFNKIFYEVFYQGGYYEFVDYQEAADALIDLMAAPNILTIDDLRESFTDFLENRSREVENDRIKREKEASDMFTNSDFWWGE